MTISVRFNDEDTKFIKEYADMNNISISELAKKAVLEKIEKFEKNKKLKDDIIKEKKEISDACMEEKESNCKMP